MAALSVTVKQVFPDLEFLGWYTNCDEPGQVEVQLHQKICPDNESYLLLTLNPTSRGSEVRGRVVSQCVWVLNHSTTIEACSCIVFCIFMCVLAVCVCVCVCVSSIGTHWVWPSGP